MEKIKLVVENESGLIEKESEIFELDENWKENSALLSEIKAYSHFASQKCRNNPDNLSFVLVEIVEGEGDLAKEVELHMEQLQDDEHTV